MSEQPPNKDSYDKFLQFSRITPENWLSPDRKNHVPFGVTQEEWVAPFMKPQLDAAVPRYIVQLFELTRGCMIYSWFFYPLATLGLEQCTRIMDSAVRERCQALALGSENFAQNLRALVGAGVISGDDEARWQAVRQLRNSRSHMKGFMLVDPGQAVQWLGITAELINALFHPSQTPIPAE